MNENEPAAATVDLSPRRPPIHRRLYDWVLSLADTSHANWSLFGISFIESSVFPIPPDALLAPLCLGNRSRSFWFALITTIGSVLGAFLGYAIGYGAIQLALHIPGITQESVDALKSEFQSRGQWYVFVAALTPIPFKLLTITAGSAKMGLGIFTMACVLGRSIRFFAVAALFRWLGPRAVPWIDKYFNWLCAAFVVLLIGGILVLKFA